MQQTSKYQFNLVDATDDFSPTPLNQNMEKVEEALAGQAAALEAAKGEFPVVRLGSYTAESATVDVSFDLSEVDMGQFAYLEMWIGGLTATAGQLQLRFNNDGGANYAATSGSGQTVFPLMNFSTMASPGDIIVTMSGSSSRIYLTTESCNYQTMSGSVGYSEGYGFYNQCGLTGLSSIQSLANASLNAEISIVLYGVKK